MIAILGVRRVMILAGLVAINAILAASIYLYFEPQSVQLERDLKRVKRETSTLIGDIDRMQIAFEQIEDQREAFKVLEEDDFFRNQSRKQAELVFNEIQKKSGVNAAVASISAGVIEDNEEARKANYKILKSPITVKIEALDDVSIYHYLWLVENYFPGHVAVENITLTRRADVNGTILRSIASGASIPLVEAEAQLIWRTMIPEDEVIEQEAGR
jgi:hypothetical protein